MILFRSELCFNRFDFGPLPIVVDLIMARTDGKSIGKLVVRVLWIWAEKEGKFAITENRVKVKKAI